MRVEDVQRRDDSENGENVLENAKKLKCFFLNTESIEMMRVEGVQRRDDSENVEDDS